MQAVQVVQWMEGHRPVSEGGAAGVQVAPIYLAQARLDREGSAAARYLASLPRRPLIGSSPGEVLSLKVAPGGGLPDHAAEEDVVLVVWRGSGRSRVGGASGREVSLSAGRALLWPKGVPHSLSAGADGLMAIVLHLPAPAVADEAPR